MEPPSYMQPSLMEGFYATHDCTFNKLKLTKKPDTFSDKK